MPEGSYVVIKLVADPARNEPINIGVLAWQGAVHELRIDREAVQRVIHQNPRLHPDSLAGLEEVVRDRLGLDETPHGNKIRERLAEADMSLIRWSEPRKAMVTEPNGSGLHTTVDRIVARVVKPRTRQSGRPSQLLDRLEREIKPLLLQGRVHRDHQFRKTRTGVERRVAFFANSATNVAVDGIRLDYVRARDVRLNADAEANKAFDILSRNDIRMVILASFSPEEDMRPVNDEARRILEAADVLLVESVADAARELGLGSRA